MAEDTRAAISGTRSTLFMSTHGHHTNNIRYSRNIAARYTAETFNKLVFQCNLQSDHFIPRNIGRRRKLPNSNFSEFERQYAERERE